jgi:hypothetical protein
MNKRKASLLTWVLLASLLILSAINIYLLISYRTSLVDRLQNDATIREEILNKVEVLDSKVLPEEKVRDIIESYSFEDGTDGKDGSNGKDGIQGKNGSDGYTPQKNLDYFDGSTPSLRCNQEYNQWEMRYSEVDLWELLNNEIVKCVGAQ